ncbi:MAG TPA: MscL family protein [Gemmatimonadota bacterium]|nr:MscL family protein [Gemmatimonadota bacterium]
MCALHDGGDVTVNYGVFINTIVTFLIVTFAVFLMVKVINRWRAGEAPDPTTRECPSASRRSRSRPGGVRTARWRSRSRSTARRDPRRRFYGSPARGANDRS